MKNIVSVSQLVKNPRPGFRYLCVTLYRIFFLKSYWSRSCILMNCASHNRSPQQIPSWHLPFSNEKKNPNTFAKHSGQSPAKIFRISMRVTNLAERNANCWPNLLSFLSPFQSLVKGAKKLRVSVPSSTELCVCFCCADA